MNAEISMLLRDRDFASAVTGMFLSGGDTFRVKPRHTVHGSEFEIIVNGDERELARRMNLCAERFYDEEKQAMMPFYSVKFYNPDSTGLTQPTARPP